MAQYPVLVFVALAFGWSWGLELSARALDGTASDSLHVAAKFGPSLAGLAAAWLCGGRTGLRALWAAATRWRVPVAWYAVAIFAPLALWVLASSYISAATSETHFERTGFALFLPLVAKHFAFGGGLGEELGWRGFLQTTLERRRSIVSASVAIGLIWGLWHAPVFLLPTEGRSGGLLNLALFSAVCVAYSLIFARVLHGARGSVLIVALMHAATNSAEKTVRTGFPHLGNAASVTYVYGALLIALGIAALWVTLPTGSHACSDSSQPDR